MCFRKEQWRDWKHKFILLWGWTCKREFHFLISYRKTGIGGCHCFPCCFDQSRILLNSNSSTKAGLLWKAWKAFLSDRSLQSFKKFNFQINTIYFMCLIIINILNKRTIRQTFYLLNIWSRWECKTEKGLLCGRTDSFILFWQKVFCMCSY